MPKLIVNIFFLLIVLIASLPAKQASRLFFKKQASQEMCDDCCDDAPEKKADDTIGFKEFPCCHHYGVLTLHPQSQSIAFEVAHADWCLPLRPAVDIHTPPPNKA